MSDLYNNNVTNGSPSKQYTKLTSYEALRQFSKDPIKTRLRNCFRSKPASKYKMPMKMSTYLPMKGSERLQNFVLINARANSYVFNLKNP